MASRACTIAPTFQNCHTRTPMAFPFVDLEWHCHVYSDQERPTRGTFLKWRNRKWRNEEWRIRMELIVNGLCHAIRGDCQIRPHTLLWTIWIANALHCLYPALYFQVYSLVCVNILVVSQQSVPYCPHALPFVLHCHLIASVPEHII